MGIIDVLADSSKNPTPGKLEGEEYLQVSQSEAKLLGRDNIDYIQDQTWATVEVSTEPGENVLVRVTGSFEAIEKAFASINDALKGIGEWATRGEDKKRKRRADGDAGGGQKRKRSSNDDANETEEHMTLGKNAFGIIVGKAGEKIKWLRAESGADVKAEKDETKTKTEVSIKGTPEQVEIAGEMIRGLLKSAERLDEPQSGQSVLEVRYDKSLSGALYGKGGENIKRVHQESGAEVNIIKEKDQTIVKFTGTTEQIEKARKMYQEITANPKQAGAKSEALVAVPPPPVMSRASGSAASAAARACSGLTRSAAGAAAPGPPSETLEYPPEMAGRIIGKMGQKLEEIQRLSQAKIQVTSGEDVCTVLIQANANAPDRDRAYLSILKAVDKINEVAKNQGFFSEQEEVLTFPVSSKARMIGKGGAKLSEFRRRTGAHVTVDKEAKDSCRVVVTGPPMCIQKAVELIKEHDERFGLSGGGQQLQLRDAEERREDGEDGGWDDGSPQQLQLRDAEEGREDAEDAGWDDRDDGSFGEEDEDPHAAADKEWWEEDNDWDNGPRG